jgi:hypothetical protein
MSDDPMPEERLGCWCRVLRRPSRRADSTHPDSWLDAWLAPDYRYFKLRGVDGNMYLVRHDERSNTWELTMFRAEHVDG